MTREAGIATSEFKLPLRVAALLPVPVCFAVLALPLVVGVAGVGTLRVELTTAEVAGIDTFAAPCWTSKYMPWKIIRERKKKGGRLASCIHAASGRTHRDGLAELAGLFEKFKQGSDSESIISFGCRILGLVRRTDM